MERAIIARVWVLVFSSALFSKSQFSLALRPNLLTLMIRLIGTELDVDQDIMNVINWFKSKSLGWFCFDLFGFCFGRFLLGCSTFRCQPSVSMHGFPVLRFWCVIFSLSRRTVGYVAKLRKARKSRPEFQSSHFKCHFEWEIRLTHTNVAIPFVSVALISFPLRIIYVAHSLCCRRRRDRQNGKSGTAGKKF